MERLQHQVGLYCRQIVNLNIFLVNSLTLEQLLVLNVGCECVYVCGGLGGWVGGAV